VFFLQLPFIAIETASNQKEMSRYLEKQGFTLLKNFDSLLLLDEVCSYCTSQMELVNFSELSYEEKVMILSWRNDPNIRKWMRNQEEIPLQNHLDFIKALKNKNDRCYFVVKVKDEYIGVIDFTEIDQTNKTAFCGLYVNPNNTKAGLGKSLMCAIATHAKEQLKLECLKLEVLQTNQRALKLYKKFGFIQTEITDKYVYMERKINYKN